MSSLIFTHHIVYGVLGLNINTPEDDLPPEIKAIATAHVQRAPETPWCPGLDDP